MLGRKRESDTHEQRTAVHGGSQLGIDVSDAPGILDIIDSIQEPLCSNEDFNDGVTVKRVGGYMHDIQDANLIDIVDSIECRHCKLGRTGTDEAQVSFQPSFKKHMWALKRKVSRHLTTEEACSVNMGLVVKIIQLKVDMGIVRSRKRICGNGVSTQHLSRPRLAQSVSSLVLNMHPSKRISAALLTKIAQVNQNVA